MDIDYYKVDKMTVTSHASAAIVIISSTEKCDFCGKIKHVLDICQLFMQQIVDRYINHPSTRHGKRAECRIPKSHIRPNTHFC